MTKLSEKERGIGLLEAYRNAPLKCDIDIRVGASETGEPCIMVEIGNEFFPMLTKTARTLAGIIEGAVRQYGDVEGISNLASALRASSDHAEALCPTPETGDLSPEGQQ